MTAPARCETPTDSLADRSQTDQTDQTDAATVTNREFLQAVFGAAPPGLPLLVAFTGNPNRVGSTAWHGQPWLAGSDPALPANANTYFSIAGFRPDADGRYRRRKAQFAALHAVVLDDIGGKVDADRLTIAPSWLLETSPGNFQFGLLLDAPLADATLADRLMQAVITAGLCDPGASGPTARLMRLPVGINGKHEPAFRCRLRQWAPQRRYGMEALIDALALDLRRPGERPRAGTQPQAASVQPAGDDVLLPPPVENPVLAALRDRRLYKQALGAGRHDITCPWLAGHTGGIDHGTVYFEPDDGFPLGGFKCQHGHCAGRHIRALLEVLGIDTAAARMVPAIRIMAGELHRIADAAESALARTGRFYQCGGAIVTVTTDPGTGRTAVCRLERPTLLRELSAAAHWQRFDARSATWQRCDPTERIVNILIDAPTYRHLPVLHGLARQPFLRADGSLCRTAGHDPASGLFGDFHAADFVIAEHPDRAAAETALRLLDDLLAEFCFAGPPDRAATLGALLTAVLRPGLPLAPMFLVRAPQIGTGKSYLCRLITAFATAQCPVPTTLPDADEECGKALLAALLDAPAVVEFDNLTDDLRPLRSLCTVLTSEHYSARRLGASKVVTVPTQALFLASGNNVCPQADMSRRCVTITLDPRCELPAQREFRHDPVEAVLAQRGRYVGAALTIVCAWLAAGRPQSTCKPIASFETWTALCRQPLLWLGQADPAAPLLQQQTDDPDRLRLGSLLVAWHAAFGSTGTRLRDALTRASAPEPQAQALLEVLTDIAGRPDGINACSLGRWISVRAGRIVDGLRFERDAMHRSTEAWRAVSV